MVHNSYVLTKTTLFSISPGQTIVYYFYTGINAFEYETTLTLHYSEYDSVTNKLLGKHSFNWIAGNNIIINDPKRSKEVRFELDGGSFYNQIAANISKLLVCGERWIHATLHFTEQVKNCRII